MQIFMNLKLTVEERKYIEVCIGALEAHFKPKRNVVYERYKFNLCSQNAEESVDDYVNRLRKLASSCQFGTLTVELIRDRLVLGITDRSAKLRLLKEDGLNLNKAVNMCRSSEIANIQLKSMSTTKETEEVNAVQEKGNRYKYPSSKFRSASPRVGNARNRYNHGQGYKNMAENKTTNLRTVQRLDNHAMPVEKNHFAAVCRSTGNPRKHKRRASRET